MFRLQDNVPQNYIDESRDFQLFCRLYDCVNNGVRFDIESMIYLFDPIRVNNKILELLASRVGFFPKKDLNDMMMRYIIASFPYIIKYKGSKRGIKEAIATVLKADNIYAKYNVSIHNIDHIIEISIDRQYDEIALKELLDYICPTGYIIKLSYAKNLSFTTELDNVDIVYIYQDPSVSASQVVQTEADWILPTYDLKVEKAETINPATRQTITNEDGSTTTTYIYYEGAKDNIEKKTLTVHIPNNNTNRYIGTLERMEVIGSTNDLTNYKSEEVKNEVDKINQKTIIFNDIDEIQKEESIICYSLKDNTINISTLSTISIDLIDLPIGSEIILEGNPENKKPTYIRDSYNNIAVVTAKQNNTVTISLIEVNNG